MKRVEQRTCHAGATTPVVATSLIIYAYYPSEPETAFSCDIAREKTKIRMPGTDKAPAMRIAVIGAGCVLTEWDQRTVPIIDM